MLKSAAQFSFVPFESSPPATKSPERGLPSGSCKTAVPLEIRVEIFERAKALRKKGLSYSGIQSVVSEEYGFSPSKSMLSEWLRGKHHPLGSANRFAAEPTPELAYVVGVEFGDGSISRKDTTDGLDCSQLIENS